VPFADWCGLPGEIDVEAWWWLLLYWRWRFVGGCELLVSSLGICRGGFCRVLDGSRNVGA